MKQSNTSSSSAGIAVDTEKSKAIDDVATVIVGITGTVVDTEKSNAVDDVAVIEERNVVNDVIAVIETPPEDITLKSSTYHLSFLYL